MTKFKKLAISALLAIIPVAATASGYNNDDNHTKIISNKGYEAGNPVLDITLYRKSIKAAHVVTTLQTSKVEINIHEMGLSYHLSYKGPADSFATMKTHKYIKAVVIKGQTPQKEVGKISTGTSITVFGGKAISRNTSEIGLAYSIKKLDRMQSKTANGETIQFPTVTTINGTDTFVVKIGKSVTIPLPQGEKISIKLVRS